MSAVIPKISRLSPAVIRILGCNPSPMTLQGTNTYLVGQGPKRLLVDAGEKNVDEYIKNLSSVLRDENCSLSDLVITHWHHDHIGGVPDVTGISDSVVKIHKFSRAEDKGQINFDYTDLRDGDEISIDGATTVKILHTPGHTTDHVALFLKEENALFSADCILGEGTAVFESLYHYMHSLDKILQCQPSVIYPGHGPVILNPIEKIQFYIEHRLAREVQIYSCLEKAGNAGLKSMEIVQHVYKETPPSLHKAADVNVNHHLEKLEAEGKVLRDGSSWKIV